MNKKKILTSVLAGIMSLSVMAGCSSSNGDSAASTSAQEKTTAEAASADTTSNSKDSTDTSAENVTLDMYFPVSVGGGPDVLISNLCDEFHKEYPNITVNPVYAGTYAETRTKVQAAIKSGNTPAIALMFSIDLYSLLSMDAIYDFDTFATSDEDK